ncbi:MAG: molybdate ABC transporter substrate-binding protein [Phycisphaerales bacterium]|nr:molybdate ABC transporter substrate-binding protein [Phycisphaerales bacterium]
MIMARVRWCWLGMLGALVLAGGCREETPAAGEDVLVLAAASTSDAITEVAAAFEGRTGIGVRISTGASNALAAQIMSGAPADVFLSANPRWAVAVEDAGLALESQVLLRNRLVVVVPRGNPAGVKDTAGLTEVKRLALAGETVPAGMYAEQALRHAGVYDALVSAGRVVRGQDVRLALSWVERGEVDAGVVYATDARVSAEVEAVYTFAAEDHDPIEYPVVLLRSGVDEARGRAFLDFLVSDEAMTIFRRHGFIGAADTAGGSG